MAEHFTVAEVVVGSSPIIRPTKTPEFFKNSGVFSLFYCPFEYQIEPGAL